MIFFYFLRIKLPMAKFVIKVRKENKKKSKTPPGQSKRKPKKDKPKSDSDSISESSDSEVPGEVPGEVPEVPELPAEEIVEELDFDTQLKMILNAKTAIPVAEPIIEESKSVSVEETKPRIKPQVPISGRSRGPVGNRAPKVSTRSTF